MCACVHMYVRVCVCAACVCVCAACVCVLRVLHVCVRACVRVCVCAACVYAACVRVHVCVYAGGFVTRERKAVSAVYVCTAV